MTKDEVRRIEEWLNVTAEPCFKDDCVGWWGRENGPALVAEVKRLRELLKRHGIDPDEATAPPIGDDDGN